MEIKQARELTAKEKREIRKLVKTMCANYDKHYDCCPLRGDRDCYMLFARLTNKMLCKYFEQAVLPLRPDLERIFKGGIINQLKPCAYCGKKFSPKGRQVYCSLPCQKEGGRIKEREKKRKQRKDKG